MPNVDSPIHVQMFDTWKKRQEKEGKTDAYGMQWGDPDINPELSKIKAQFVSPFIDRSHTALEIGPGGGRWTRYLLGFAKVYAVDLHEKLLEEHARNIRSDKVTQIRNNGSDFPCIPDGSVHYLCSFATFVHFDIELIADYLHNMRRVLAPGANVVIQYADKDKPKARDNPGFADTTPAQVRALLASLGYTILDEDLDTIWHSAFVRFTPGDHPGQQEQKGTKSLNSYSACAPGA